MTHEIFIIVGSIPTPQDHVQRLKLLVMLKQRKIQIVSLIQQKTPSFRLSQILVSNHFWFQRASLDFGWSVDVGPPPSRLIDPPPEDHEQFLLLKN